MPGTQNQQQNLHLQGCLSMTDLFTKYIICQQRPREEQGQVKGVGKKVEESPLIGCPSQLTILTILIGVIRAW